MKNLFDKLIRKPKDDLFITFVQVAIEDDAIKARMISILKQPHPQRLALLNDWYRSLEAEGAPKEMIEILRYLEDEPRANQTLLILQKTDSKSKD